MTDSDMCRRENYGVRLNRLPEILIQCAVLIVPFLYIGYTLDPVLTPRFLLLSILLFVIIASMLMSALRQSTGSELSFLRRAIFPILIGYLFISATSLMQARNAADSMFDILKFTLFIVLVLIMTKLLAASKAYLSKLAGTITIVAAGLSLIAILQYLDIGFRWIPGNVIPYGTMANKNLLASFLFLSLPFVIYNWLKSDRYWRAGSIATVTLCLYVLVISQTRTVWLALAVATLMTMIPALVLKTSDKRRAICAFRRRHSLAAFTVAVLIAVVASFATIGLHQSERIEGDSPLPINLSDASLRQRIALWEKSLSMFADNPILGTGVGDWKIEIAKYGTDGLPSSTGQVFFQRPHNDFLWVLAETGPLGLLFYISIFLIAFSYCLGSLRAATSRDDVQLCLLTIFGLVGFLVISCFSFPKERIAHSVLLALMIAVSTSVYHRLRPPMRAFPKTNIAAVLMAALFCLALCLVVGASRYNSEMHTRNAMEAKSVSDWKRVVVEIDKAELAFSVFDATSTPLAWHRGVANFNLNDIAAAQKDFQKAYRQHPYHVHVLNNLAACYETLGDHDSAIEYYNEAMEIIPNFEETLINLVAVYYNVRDYQRAYDCLMQIEGEPSDPRYEHFMQKVSEKLGEPAHP
ncbi:MAG: O-antigen ligase family protein [Candidatus Zixiibacteriota bacterium]